MSHERTDGLEVEEWVIGTTQVEWCFRGGWDTVANSVDNRRLRLLPGLCRINIDIGTPSIFGPWYTSWQARLTRGCWGNAFTGAIAGAAIGLQKISASSCAY